MDLNSNGFVWRGRADYEAQLNAALESFDWTTTDTLVEALGIRLGQGTTELDQVFANRVMSDLQRKRRFKASSRAGDAFLQAGLSAPSVRRRYAQALIERGLYQAASSVLRGITVDPEAPLGEQEEARGLLGRISKQIYVNLKQPKNQRNVSELQAAIDSYWVTYEGDPTKHLWHGINVVACLCRAERDGVKLRVPGESKQIAADLLTTLATQEQTGELSCWDHATYLEACLALGNEEGAVERAQLYVRAKGVDAFEIGSTLRQLEEVWQLRDDSNPGGSILPILRASLLKQSGGSLQLSAAAADANRLQKVFASDGAVTLSWFQKGLECARSVVRVERNGRGVGTGWIMDVANLRPGTASRKVLVTNAHVIGPDTPNRYPSALRPEDATLNFLMLGAQRAAGKVLFHSPVNELDATFLALDDAPEGATALVLDTTLLKVEKTPQRLYMIGCPGGRDLEFSLQDNYLLAASEQRVHYRTPSEPGSSGSPVFGPTGWKVTALHHAGSAVMPRLDGAGTYEANEGIALAAFRLAQLQ